jgi:hypothetical protein
MEVHTHTHTERKKWTHYLWEFLMLFLAVFCGFLAENQREHMVEHNRAKDYARALIRDLKSDTASINRYSGYYTLFITTMDSMINMAIKKQINPATSGRFAWFCRHSLWHVPLPWQRTTMEQITSSGNIRYFKSYQLQEMISNYNIEIESFIQTFILENPSSDKARDLTNKILDVETNYEYSKINLATQDQYPRSYIDSLINHRVVSLENKQELINELVNMAVYRRRNYLSIKNHIPEIKTMATDLINELKKEYHLQ